MKKIVTVVALVAALFVLPGFALGERSPSTPLPKAPPAATMVPTVAAPPTAPTTPTVAQPVEVQPSPGPAIGIGQVGSPTYVVPAPVVEKKGGIINIGQAFNDAAAPYINAAVEALILALVTYAGALFTKKTGIQIDQQHRDALVKALQNQAGSLIADGLVKIQDAQIHVNNDSLAVAANNLLKSIPDAEKHFGLTPDFVAQRIVDTIPQIAAGAQMIAQAHTAPAAPAA